MTPLEQKLNQLALSTMSRHVETTLTEAAAKNLSASATLEWLADMTERVDGVERITLGADKGYDTKEFVKEMRGMAGRPIKVAIRIEMQTTARATGRPGRRRPPRMSARIAATPIANTIGFVPPIWLTNTTSRSKKLLPPPASPNRLGSCVMRASHSWCEGLLRPQKVGVS